MTRTKTFWLGAVAVLFGASALPAQVVYPIQPSTSGFITYQDHASTAAEGYLRGMGAVVRSFGQANLDHSAAALNYSEARKNELVNAKSFTETYFAIRDINRRARAAERGPRPTEEDWIRFAQAGKPKPLSPSELDTITGEIRWPILLRTDEFDKYRDELERLFAERAAAGAIGADAFLKVHQASNSMLDDLRDRIREVPPTEYMAARRFLESLAFEAGQPVL